MPLFRHPCLVRGTVHTPYGAFSIERGLVELPEDVGEALGWPLFEGEQSVVEDPINGATPRAEPAFQAINTR